MGGRFFFVISYARALLTNQSHQNATAALYRAHHAPQETRHAIRAL